MMAFWVGKVCHPQNEYKLSLEKINPELTKFTNIKHSKYELSKKKNSDTKEDKSLD